MPEPLAYDRAVEVFTYDAETGSLWWKTTNSNRAKAGTEAGSIDGKGYRRVRVDGVTYRYHRVIWLMHTGVWPELDIDHINRNLLDNRISNLRLATKSQNQVNRPGWSKSGMPKGVYRHGKRFVAQAWKGGRKHHLGTYDTPEQAHAAYLRFARATFGEFARST